MAVVREIKRRARQILPQVFAACLVGYFLFHAVQGDSGLLAYSRLQDALDKARAVESELSSQRARLEHRVSLLRPDNLDPDLLAEQARKVLNFARPEEVVVMENDSTRANRPSP